MRLKKTNSNQRRTYSYSYIDEKGRKVLSELVPGVSGVTVDHIKLLHALDDSEVYNNIKNAKAPLEDWQKEAVENWKQAHPYEDIPKNWSVSLNAIISESEDDVEYGTIVADPKTNEVEENTAIERLHVVVSELSMSQQVIYQKYFIEGKTKVQIAKEEEVSEGAIRKTVKKIEEIISNDEILKKIFS